MHEQIGEESIYEDVSLRGSGSGAHMIFNSVQSTFFPSYGESSDKPGPSITYDRSSEISGQYGLPGQRILAPYGNYFVQLCNATVQTGGTPVPDGGQACQYMGEDETTAGLPEKAEISPRLNPAQSSKPESSGKNGDNATATKRRCISTACTACRKRKSKCDGQTPSCVYDPDSDHRRKGVFKQDIERLRNRNSYLEELLLNRDYDSLLSSAQPPGMSPKVVDSRVEPIMKEYENEDPSDHYGLGESDDCDPAERSFSYPAQPLSTPEILVSSHDGTNVEADILY
ncbi:hypothetical protein FQN50_009555 [Emmonsiellopsis sp. PD_5]|nr:hypothetical protein FQN50_009555 [Emmonsiellopsis sp. PD_5]